MVRSSSVRAAPAESGFTLIEMIVALALFGLISLAGFALVDTALRARARTEGRADRLAAIERAVAIVDADIGQIAPGPITLTGTDIEFRRHTPAGDVPIRYSFAAGTLARSIGGRSQMLLNRVTGGGLSFYAAGEGWRDSWPPSRERADEWPRALALVVALAPGDPGPGGTIRRVIELPAKP